MIGWYIGEEIGGDQFVAPTVIVVPTLRRVANVLQRLRVTTYVLQKLRVAAPSLGD
jgi:hypothetical protein